MKRFVALFLICGTATAQSDLHVYQITCSTKADQPFAVVTWFVSGGAPLPTGFIREEPNTAFAEALVVNDGQTFHVLYDPVSASGSYRKALTVSKGQAAFRPLPNGEPIPVNCSAPRELEPGSQFSDPRVDIA